MCTKRSLWHCVLHELMHVSLWLKGMHGCGEGFARETFNWFHKKA